MSQLITIAERIKVITNIQKTAHAMQLISMSTLSRVGNKKKNLQLYTQQLEALAQELGFDLTTQNNSFKRPLYLIIGSQKGFCGSFNITLFNYIKELQKHQPVPFWCVAVGPYAYDFCTAQKMTILNDKIAYTLANLAEKADQLFNTLKDFKAHTDASRFTPPTFRQAQDERVYDHIVVLSNHNASIFLQRAQKTVLPLHYASQSNVTPTAFKIEQPLEEIADYIGNLTLKNQLIQLMLESLRAENSARALSMDNSTRNAKNLLTDMKLEYNKLRQAKVTKELTELSSSLLDL